MIATPLSQKRGLGAMDNCAIHEGIVNSVNEKKEKATKH